MVSIEEWKTRGNDIGSNEINSRRATMDINTKYNEGKAAFTKVWEEFLDTQDVINYRAALSEWKATDACKKVYDCGYCVDEDKLTTEEKYQLNKYNDAKKALRESEAYFEFKFKRQLVKYLLVSDGGISIPDFWCTDMINILDFDVNT